MTLQRRVFKSPQAIGQSAAVQRQCPQGDEIWIHFTKRLGEWRSMHPCTRYSIPIIFSPSLSHSDSDISRLRGFIIIQGISRLRLHSTPHFCLGVGEMIGEMDQIHAGRLVNHQQANQHQANANILRSTRLSLPSPRTPDAICLGAKDCQHCFYQNLHCPRSQYHSDRVLTARSAR